MDSRTLKALNASIAEWKKNAEATKTSDVLLGVADCPLCNLFWKLDRGESCVGCPVFSQGHFRCDGTPYDDAEQRYSEWDDEGIDEYREAFCAAAQDEVDFLRSLLPAEAAPEVRP